MVNRKTAFAYKSHCIGVSKNKKKENGVVLIDLASVYSSVEELQLQLPLQLIKVDPISINDQCSRFRKLNDSLSAFMTHHL